MQQVNLYSPELRPQTDLLTAEKSFAVVITLIVIIVILTFFKLSELNQLVRTATSLENRSESLKEVASALKNKPTTVIKNDIEREIAVARSAIKNRKNIETLLSGKKMGNKVGFSQHFRAISEAIPQSVTIHEFALLEAGSLASFAGESQKIENIPLFFDKLHKQKPFSKTRFGSLEIEKSGNVHTFSIGPKANDPSGKLVQR